MLKIIKKLFTKKVSSTTPKEVPVETHNYDLINQITDIIHSDDFEHIYFKPVSKIYLITVYSTSLSDLLDNVTNKNFNRSISAVSLHSYLEDSHHDLQRQFFRILKILPGYKLSPLIEHDLIEFCDAYSYLKELGVK